MHMEPDGRYGPSIRQSLDSMGRVAAVRYEREDSSTLMKKADVYRRQKKPRSVATS